MVNFARKRSSTAASCFSSLPNRIQHQLQFPKYCCNYSSLRCNTSSPCQIGFTIICSPIKYCCHYSSYITSLPNCIHRQTARYQNYYVKKGFPRYCLTINHNWGCCCCSRRSSHCSSEIVSAASRKRTFPVSSDLLTNCSLLWYIQSCWGCSCSKIVSAASSKLQAKRTFPESQSIFWPAH